jgi:hypothetical protein
LRENERDDLAEDRFRTLAVSEDFDPCCPSAPRPEAQTIRLADGLSDRTDLLPPVAANPWGKEDAMAVLGEIASP